MSMMTLAEGTRSSLRPAILLASAANFLLAISIFYVGAPIAALVASYVAGGTVTAGILFAYLSNVLWNAPVLLVTAVMCASALVTRQLASFFSSRSTRMCENAYR